jgi:serine/threonine-protein kinase
MRALQAQPDARYLTAAEMSEDLISDLGDFDVLLPTVPERYATEDPKAWEKLLRRALGDDYELLEELGSGGYGRVYKVRDLSLEREVALKVLHPYLTADSAVVERFRREARTAAQLVHPHIVNVYEIGGRAGLQWYTMEYVRGRSVDRIVTTSGPMSFDGVVRLLFEALDALALAHSKNLVHRDLKPENLLIEDETGDVRIADFGLALALGGKDRFGGATSQSGTPAFAAPEQLLGERVDHRVDLYSLSLTAFYALTGKLPFTGPSIEAVLASQTVSGLPDVRSFRNDIPPGVATVLARGAARHLEDRFPSASAYATALGEALGLPSFERHGHRWWERLTAP